MKKDRRPTSAISSQRISAKEDVDPFEEDESERRFLTSKPTCFIVLGKPGSGKTSLCKSLSRIWKCQFVNGSNSIAYSIEFQTELGKQAQQILHRGELLSEELSVKILQERLKSPEVSHYGYVLDDFPSVSEDFLSMDDQFEFLKKLPLKPDFIIKLRIPDEDLKNRRKGFRVDPLTHETYTEERYNPPVKQEKETGDGEEDEDEEAENDDAEDSDEDDELQSVEENEDEFIEDGEDEDLPPDLVERLIPRTEDFEENIDASIKQYKDLLRRKIEDYLGNHEREKVIELDANMSKKCIVKTLIQKLDSLAVKRAAVPLRLQGGEDQEEIPDDTETDDLLRTLAATEIIATGFRWRRSRWGRFCPVALYEGNIVQGSPQYAVSFLDKLYVMSSMDALEKFLRNPRPYILNPQPRNPCKVCIVGPALSGKTTLATRLATKYGAKIIDVEAMIKPRMEAQRAEMIENVRKEALESAITKVSAIVQQEKLAAEQAKAIEEDEDKRSSEEKKEDSIDGDNEVSKEVEDKQTGAGDEGGEEATSKEDVEIEDDDDDDSETVSKSTSESDDKKDDLSLDLAVDENHPQVKKIVNEALEEALNKDMSILPDEYIELLEEAIHEHYQNMQQKHPLGPIAGRWILDNFPHTREQFNLMVERGILPDNLVCLKDGSENEEFLLKRWYKLKRQADGDDTTDLGDSIAEEEMPPHSAELEAQKSLLVNFDKNWTGLQGAIRSMSTIEPHLIDCNQDEDTIEADVVEYLEEKFQYKGWEYTGMDQDEEEEDLVDDDDDEDEEDDEEDDIFNTDKKKPFGDTKNYCPVALNDDNVLWPGLPDVAAKYREKVYYFSSTDSRAKFLENPKEFLPKNEPLKPPALRLIMLGAAGSGKTTVGRELAKKFGVFHISFKDRLQELIIAKTKKRIGPDYPEEEPEDDENEAQENEEGVEDNTEKEEAKAEPASPDPKATEQEPEETEEIAFTDFEANIRDNIMDNEPLSNATLDSIIPAWWKEEPFRSTGFILEGFPRTAEEARYLAEAGFYPDCVINFAAEENDIVDRLLPPLLNKWKIKRDKRLAKKQRQLEIKLKKRNEEKGRRIEAKLKELAQKKADKEFARQSSGSDEDSDEQEEEDDEDEDEDIDAVIEAEMAEEEEDETEEEEEETEDEANERIRMELAEKYYTEFDGISTLQEIFEEFLVPRMDVEAGRKARIVQFLIERNLKPIVENRGSLFDRSKTINFPLAKKMLVQGYKQFSKFGRWCPVQLSEGNFMPPYETSKRPLFPVIYRQHIYFFSSEENKEKFILYPFKYLHQPAPKPMVPIHIAIIGPPKSGKTTLSNRFVQEYGIKRLSAGEALRYVTLNQSKTTLALLIEEYLKVGQTVPDELVAQAIDVSMLDVQCQTRGFVLDGYPVVERQLEFLTERSIIPYKVIELKLDSRTTFSRADVDRRSPNRTLPLHDSHMITAVRLGAYMNSIGSIRAWYDEKHRNIIAIDGEESKWKIWNSTLIEVKAIVKKIQIYLERIAQDKAACISELCITPAQLSERLGIFGHYCPVSYVDKGELVDCAEDETQAFAAEFRGHYYKMSTELELGIFLENAERYTPPQVDKQLPPEDLLPKKLTGSDVKEMFPIQTEMMGYCPVTYLEGDFRYEALIPGDTELGAKYKGRLYLFVSEAKREKFMRLPEKYSSLKLPNKLPPKRDPLPVSGLPMLGYMEQTLEFAIRKAATAVGCLKPKFPFLSAKQSALLYMAYHLKAYNPKASEYVRTKYKKKLESFESQCELIKYLGRNMTRRYKEPEDRRIDFDYKLNSFMALKTVVSSGVKQ